MAPVGVPGIGGRIVAVTQNDEDPGGKKTEPKNQRELANIHRFKFKRVSDSPSDEAMISLKHTIERNEQS